MFGLITYCLPFRKIIRQSEKNIHKGKETLHPAHKGELKLIA